MTADAGQFRAPRLTKLEVQGFKSFLNRTTLVFEPGITAVVGPNGSGKSNVADALRWVLGEQGQAALRARKTEEVIFAGGQGRAPAGMAEATLVFDNSEGWLPTEFTEARFPFRVESLSLAVDSGGAGKFRGGLGYEKHIRMLKDGHFMSIADRSILACWGVKGGLAGQPFQVTIDPGGPAEREVDALADAENDLDSRRLD